MVKERDGVQTREDWEFKAHIYGVDYRAVWTYSLYEKHGIEAYNLNIERDGEDYYCNQSGQEDPLVTAFRAATVAFRIEELKHSFEGISENDRWMRQEAYHVRLKDVLVELAERSWEGEYLGQTSDSTFYLQHAAPILGVDMKTMWGLIHELMVEKRLGLNGAILIPYEKYRSNKKASESYTGHKDYDSSDMGGWWCNYCGARKWPEENVNPKDIACVKDAYVDAS